MAMRKFLAIFSSVLFLVTMPIQADPNLLVIVDGSNSMWGQIDGVAKIETAKNTLSDLVANLPAETKVGLMAYGHSAKGDCQNVEVLSAIGDSNRAAIVSQIKGLQPKGKTPIAYSLAQSTTAFKDFEGQNNYVLLISDGIESCDGDPCAAAQALNDAELAVTAHVVGFGLTKDEGGQLQCIASNTGGQYFDASDTAGFDSAIKKVAQLTEVEPEPEPVSMIVFEDSFDGDALSADWNVLNPDLDQYIVEDGSLLLIGKEVGGLRNAQSPNLIKLLTGLPSGDWTITVTVQPEFQTGSDQLTFGLFTDEQNFVATNIYATDNFCCRMGNKTHNIMLQTVKVAKGESTLFEERTREMLDSGTNAFSLFVETKEANKELTVKLVKKGRSYQSSLHYDGEVDDKGNPLWITTDLVSSLRAPKSLVINASQTNRVEGETLFLIHDITIEKN